MPQHNRRSDVLSRLARRLADPSGVAGLVAIGFLAVLGIVGAGAVTYSTDNYGSAVRSKGDQLALALAEAGLNNALATLNNPTNDPLSEDLLPETTLPYEGGAAVWWGHLDGNVWTITGTGEVRNPSGTAPLRRVVTAKVNVESSLTQPLLNDAWNYLVATRTGNACDMTLASDVALDSRVLVQGNLCFSSGARITGGDLIVRGQLTLQTTNNYVGSTSTPIAAAHVVGGCKYANQHAHPDLSHPTHPFCSATDRVYANVLDQLPQPTLPPVAAFDAWYHRAAPGPFTGCSVSSGSVPQFDNDSVRNNSLPSTVRLAPSGASYSCVVGNPDAPAGELSWDASSKVLTVRGTIYFDGNVIVDNGTMSTYEGLGTIYTSGAFVFSSSSRLCAAAAGSECDYAGWEPANELLAVVADGNGGGGAFVGNGMQFGAFSRFQGAAYATNAIQFGSYSKMQGPMIASTIISCSAQEFPPFRRLTEVPSGLPGNPPSAGRPGQPYDFDS